MNKYDMDSWDYDLVDALLVVAERTVKISHSRWVADEAVEIATKLHGLLSACHLARKAL